MKVVLAIVLGVESIRDIKQRELWIVLPGILMVIGIIKQWCMKEITIKETAIMALVLVAAAVISKVTREALGMGDVWVMGSIMGVCGLLEGIESILLAFLLSAFYGGVLLVKGKGRNTQIPFVPFLLAGVLGGVWL